MKRTTLRQRFYWLLFQWFVLFLVASGAITALSFARFRETALEERLLLARTLAHALDSTAEAALQDLGRLVPRLTELDDGIGGILRSFRFHSPFREAVYLLDEAGRKIVADPPSTEPMAWEQPPSHEVVTSLFYKPGDTKRATLAIIQPFVRDGRKHYLVAEMNPLGSLLSTFLQNLTTEPHLHVVVVDDNGIVIAAPDHKQLFRVMPEAAVIGDRIRGHRPLVLNDAQCGACDDSQRGGKFLTVMAPLRFAPWGVVVQQHPRRAFAALYTSQYGLMAVGTVLLLMGGFLMRALLRSVVSPIQELSEQADVLRRGDLTHPIEVAGDHEVALLAATMDAARQRLATTLGELRVLNVQLEDKVSSRTEALKKQFENLRLMNDVYQTVASESDLDRLVPRLLSLIAGHYSFAALAIVTQPPEEPAAAYGFPESAALPWLKVGAEAPDGWQKLDLSYQGNSQGQIYHPRMGTSDGALLVALQQQLALSLHGTYLLKHTLSQDRQRRALVRRLLNAGEEERKRIARELHDEIAQLLTVIQFSLEDAPIETDEIKKAKDLLNQTQKEIHRIIYDLRPSLLDDLGLSAAIKWYATNYLAAKGHHVSLEIDDDLAPLPAEVQVVTFRICQEIITNILRHSRAENVSLELYTTSRNLVLAVEDDGEGFSPEDHLESAGLVGMRERAAIVNGTIEIDSAPAMGTQVVLKVPIET